MRLGPARDQVYVFIPEGGTTLIDLNWDQCVQINGTQMAPFKIPCHSFINQFLKVDNKSVPLTSSTDGVTVVGNTTGNVV